MNPPGQVTGDRRIPDGAISRHQIGEILYQHLADIRRREGVDPARYPAVDYDLQYDTLRELYGAEIVARETSDLLLPAILAGRNPDRRHWLPRLLRHPLLAVGAIVIAGYAGLRELSTTAARQQSARRDGSESWHLIAFSAARSAGFTPTRTSGAAQSILKEPAASKSRSSARILRRKKC